LTTETVPVADGVTTMMSWVPVELFAEQPLRRELVNPKMPSNPNPRN
jgi:hypothetical protein